MAEFFGDLERLAADAYPYRWPILAGVVVLLTAAGIFVYRKAWHMFFWRRRLATAIVGAPLLALFGFVSYDLGYPLFTNKTVEEEFPFAYAAEIPDNMEMEDVEMIMSGLSQIDSVVQENMPKDMISVIPVPDAPTSEDESSPESSGDSNDSTAAVSSTPGTAALKSGNFRDADSFHRGSGIATIYRGPDGSHILRLEELDVTNGPDLRVLLARHGDPMNRDEVKDPGYIELDKLKGNRGNQNYPIPDHVDPSVYNSIVIYCAPFSVVFSVAPLLDIS